MKTPSLVRKHHLYRRIGTGTSRDGYRFGSVANVHCIGSGARQRCAVWARRQTRGLNGRVRFLQALSVCRELDVTCGASARSSSAAPGCFFGVARAVSRMRAFPSVRKALERDPFNKLTSLHVLTAMAECLSHIEGGIGSWESEYFRLAFHYLDWKRPGEALDMAELATVPVERRNALMAEIALGPVLTREQILDAIRRRREAIELEIE